MSWNNLQDLCVKLGHSGICPEALETVARIHGYLNDDVRDEYKDFMDKAKRFFAAPATRPHTYAEGLDEVIEGRVIKC